MNSARICAKDMRNEKDIFILWNICYSQCARSKSHSNRSVQLTVIWQIVYKMHGQREPGDNVESKGDFHNAIDVVLNEMNDRFSECNSNILCALSVLQTETKDLFLITAKIAPVWHLCVGAACCDSIIFTEATDGLIQFMSTRKLDVRKNLKLVLWKSWANTKRCYGLLNFRRSLVRASVTTWGWSISTLKNVFFGPQAEHALSSQRQPNQLFFKKDLTNKFKDDRKVCFIKSFLRTTLTSSILGENSKNVWCVKHLWHKSMKVSTNYLLTLQSSWRKKEINLLFYVLIIDLKQSLMLLWKILC